MQIPTTQPVKTVGAADGLTLIEIHQQNQFKFLVVVRNPDGSARMDSKRGMQYSRALSRAVWLAGTY